MQNQNGDYTCRDMITASMLWYTNDQISVNSIMYKSMLMHEAHLKQAINIRINTYPSLISDMWYNWPILYSTLLMRK